MGPETKYHTDHIWTFCVIGVFLILVELLELQYVYFCVT